MLMGVGLVTISIVGPIDRTPLEQQPFYQRMMTGLDTFRIASNPAKEKIKIGWSKINLTPAYPRPMAGYTLREHFKSVHDSLFARILYIDNGAFNCFIITADLLLFPPILKSELEAAHENEFFYFSGTHTHNGIGGWNNSIGGQFILGDYDAKWVKSSVEAISAGMQSAKASALSSSLSYWEVDATEYAENRLVGEAGLVDGKLRGINVIRQDSSHAVLMSYSAHPTSISKKSTALSADYPGALISKFEKNGTNFGMFLAGMVGSHRWKNPKLADFELVEQEGNLLYEKATQAVATPSQDLISIAAVHVPVPLGPSQLRISKNWKLRDWVFKALMGKLKAEITYLKLGNIILLGTPCDFSGEIYVANRLGELAARNGEHLIITSFNGNYTGYITLDERYDPLKKEEVMAMNWVGPYFGAYYGTIIERLLQK